MTDLVRRIRDAHAPSVLSDAEIARGWDDVVERLKVTPVRTVRRTHRVSRRVLIAVVIAVISLASVALAQDRALRELVGLTDAERSAERMDVFGQPAISRRSWPDMLAPIVGASGTPSYVGPLDIDPNGLRPALTYRSGGYVVRLWLAPGGGGQACLVDEIVGRSGGLSCSYGMKFNGHVTVGTSYDIRQGAIVMGLADNDVEAIHVRMSNGKSIDAMLQNNAYAVRLPDPSIRARGLDIELRDGRTIEVAMNGCLRRQVVPAPKSRLGCGYGMNRGPADVRLS